MRRQLILFTLIFLLGSCASTQWVKQGATPEDLKTDTVACQNQVLTSDVGARGMMGMGAPTPRGRGVATSSARAQADLEIAKRLEQKGWTQERRIQPISAPQVFNCIFD